MSAATILCLTVSAATTACFGAAASAALLLSQISAVSFHVPSRVRKSSILALFSKLGKKKFIYTVLFWLAVSYIAGSMTYLILSAWWFSFIFVALLVASGFIIHFVNKKRDLKAIGAAN